MARDGDHLMVTFQCELCHFRNIQGKNPSARKARDYDMLCHIRRANLDAFWSREPKSVQNNVKEARRSEQTADRFGIDSMTPPMGPFPLKDSVGMKAALCVLDRSQDTGRYEAKVQPNTYRKVQSAISNITRAGVAGLGDTVGAHEKKKVWVSSAGTHQHWFSRFRQGIKKRTGEVIRQDKAITIDVLVTALDGLDEKWRAATSFQEKLAASRMGLWYSGGFSTALRGEEMLIIELAGTFNSMEHLMPHRHKDPYFCFHVNGRTKANRDAGASFKIPMVGKTGRNKIANALWAERYRSDVRNTGLSRGYLFGKPDGGKARLADFEEDFYEVLEEVRRRRPDLIGDDVDIREEYGIWRSLRRGVSSHAINMKVSKNLIELINRWRSEKDRQSQSATMIDVYTELEDLIPTLLRYSKAL